MNSMAIESKRFKASGAASLAKFCSFDGASDLFCYATPTSIQVMRATFETGEQLPELEPLRQFGTGSQACALDWTPATASGPHGTSISLVAAFNDHSIRLFQDDADPINLSLMSPHQAAINDVAVNRTSGHLVASVSDDKTCRIWRTDPLASEADENSNIIVMRLKSRGVSVNWNDRLASQVLVGESSGAIRILDVEKQTWLFSVFQPDSTGPAALLRSVDWNPYDPNMFGAVIGRRWYVWNLKRKQAIHLPEHSGEAHPEIGDKFRWSISDPKMFATSTNAPEGPFTRRIAAKVFTNVFTKGPRSLALPFKSRLTSISWHRNRPVLAGTAGDQIILWAC